MKGEMLLQDTISIKIERNLKEELDKLKIHPNQAISEIVQMLYDNFKKGRTKKGVKI